MNALMFPVMAAISKAEQPDLHLSGSLKEGRCTAFGSRLTRYFGETGKNEKELPYIQENSQHVHFSFHGCKKLDPCSLHCFVVIVAIAVAVAVATGAILSALVESPVVSVELNLLFLHLKESILSHECSNFGSCDSPRPPGER